MPPQKDQTALTPSRVFTVGHSNHSMGHFLGLLKMHAVQVVADVRSQPYSKYARHFNQQPLKQALHEAELRYVYLGRELGGRPEGEGFYDAEGRVLYDRVAATGLFQEGLSRLERGIREYKVVLVCAEENPAYCHRRLLVSHVLADRGVLIEHIRGDGRIQTEEEVAAEAGQNRDQLSFFQKAGRHPWKSIPSVARKKRSRHETPSQSASA